MNAPLAQVQIREREGDTCIQENGFCPDWIAENFDRYMGPLGDHVFLTVVSVAVGFGIATALALIAHRRRWLTGPFTGVTGVLYTIPSLSFFFLLQPITGRGNLTAVVALVSYTLLIIFRNVTTGLRNVPEETVDAARGMGLTERQLLWKVELPHAMPTIMAGLTQCIMLSLSMVVIAALVGADGLGKPVVRALNTVNVARGFEAGLAIVLVAIMLDRLCRRPGPAGEGG